MIRTAALEITNSHTKPQINNVPAPLGLSTLLHANHQVVPGAERADDNNSVRSAGNSSYLNSKSVPNISNNNATNSEISVTNAP